MKINYTLKNGYINSYSIIPFDADKPTLDIKAEDEKLLMTCKCKINNNKLDTKEALVYIQELNNRSKLIVELNQLNDYVSNYDKQLAAYNRQMHLYNHSDIDIAKLDTEIKLKLDRIKEIQNILAK